MTGYTRALTTDSRVAMIGGAIAADQVDLAKIAQHMYSLMMRNIASDGYQFLDSTHSVLSEPGCIIAAPSYPAEAPGTSQDYLFNWTRDAAITALEIAAASPVEPGTPVEPLIDYVRFAAACQANATPTRGHACFQIDGQVRPWSEQNDGPAFQIIATLSAYDLLDEPTQQIATQLISDNLTYLLGCYAAATTNLWEEHQGFSFFTRSVQLRCFIEISDNTIGLAVPDAVSEAVDWLTQALAAHWNGSSYSSMMGGDGFGQPDVPVTPPGYDPNIDIVLAANYGAVSCTDTKLLATTALLRTQWVDPNSSAFYPINASDTSIGFGPMLGRYPGDTYDGGAGGLSDHPWALCTANVAQLYYDLATHISATGTVPFDDQSADFFTQVNVTGLSSAADAAAALRAAGDAMLRAIIYHSDDLELSEQFDGASGYEKSVRNLTWSYAAFLSAVRARTNTAVEG